MRPRRSARGVPSGPRALDEFDRLKALRPDPGGADRGTHVVCGSVCVLPETAPAATFDETNPIPPEPPQSEELASHPLNLHKAKSLRPIPAHIQVPQRVI